MGFGTARQTVLVLAGWSYQTFVESQVTDLRTRTTWTPRVCRLELLGANAAKVAVPTGAIRKYRCSRRCPPARRHGSGRSVS